MLSGVLSAIHGEMLADIMPGCGVLDNHEHCVRMVSIQRYGKAKFGGQIVLDIDPIISRVGTLIDAAVVLLVECIGLSGVLDEAVNTLAELGILLGEEASAYIFIGEDPTLSPIIRAQAADGGYTYPHSG